MFEYNCKARRNEEMDPNVAYKRMFEADTYEDAKEAACDLVLWIASGGFKPEGYDANMVRHTLTSKAMWDLMVKVMKD